MERIIVGLLGGPGIGKSTACSGLFTKLKKLQKSVEISHEYVKDWVWEKRTLHPGDQIYLTAQQMRKEQLYMLNDLDYIITDAPVALTAFYGDRYDFVERQLGACKLMMEQHFEYCALNGYKIKHYLLSRANYPYDSVGRFETEEEALSIDAALINFLDDNSIAYTSVPADSDVESIILSDLLEDTNVR